MQRQVVTLARLLKHHPNPLCPFLRGDALRQKEKSFDGQRQKKVSDGSWGVLFERPPTLSVFIDTDYVGAQGVSVGGSPMYLIEPFGVIIIITNVYAGFMRQRIPCHRY